MLDRLEAQDDVDRAVLQRKGEGVGRDVRHESAQRRMDHAIDGHDAALAGGGHGQCHRGVARAEIEHLPRHRAEKRFNHLAQADAFPIALLDERQRLAGHRAPVRGRELVVAAAEDDRRVEKGVEPAGKSAPERALHHPQHRNDDTTPRRW